MVSLHCSPMHKLTISILFLLYSYICQAQKNAYSGYYIDMSGNVVKGTIADYKQIEKNPQKFLFRVSAGQQIILTPTTARYVEIENHDSYIAYNGPRMINNTNEQKAFEQGISNNENQFDSVSVFLR
jgi:hypothetical protein